MSRGKPIGRQPRTDQLTITLAIQREKRVKLEKEYHESKSATIQCPMCYGESAGRDNYGGALLCVDCADSKADKADMCERINASDW